ncbi:MAG: NYN domain-containing protein [Myxococcota bacterium]
MKGKIKAVEEDFTMNMLKKTTTRVALFFDGGNFYSGWKENANSRRVDFTRLAKWLVQRAGGTLLAGAYYYTGVSEVSDERSGASHQKLMGFLEMLESQPGFFVHTFRRKVGSIDCEQCGIENRYTSDKEADLAVVSHMLQLAAVDAYDIAVLMSGDVDYTPALQSARAMGKQVHVASWGGTNASKRLKAAAFSHIDMLEGLDAFEHTSETSDSLSLLESNEASIKVTRFTGDQRLDGFMSELVQAEKKFEGGYVGMGYFLNSWRSIHLDDSPQARREVLNHLVDQNLVDSYEVEDGKTALRLSRQARDQLRELYVHQPTSDEMVIDNVKHAQETLTDDEEGMPVPL